MLPNRLFLGLLFLLVGAATQNECFASDISNHEISPQYARLKEACTLNGRGLYEEKTLPLQSLSFVFDAVNGVNRQVFLFALLCKNLLAPEDILEKVADRPVQHDGDFEVYDIGIENQFHVKRDRSFYYFCDRPSARPNDAAAAAFRGCNVEIPIDPLYKFGSGQTLIAGYGIDYTNRRHIQEVNEAIRSRVWTH